MADKQKQIVEGLKSRGNDALNRGMIGEAIKCYSEALQVDPQNAMLFSNRSVAYARSMRYKEALEDAETVVKLKPGWSKGYLRKGVALGLLDRWEEATMAFLDGLSIDPTNETIRGALKEAKSHVTGPGKDQPIVTPFSDPKLFDKILNNPQTKGYLKDTEYMHMIQEIQRDPSKLSSFMEDERIMKTLGLLLGVELETQDGPTQATTPPTGLQTGMPSATITELTDEEAAAEEARMASAKVREAIKQEAKEKVKKLNEKPDKKEAPEKNPQRERSPVPEPPEPFRSPAAEPPQARKKSPVPEPPQPLSGAEKQALEEKEKGNAAYKKKDFAVALEHYDKAIELDPTNIVFRNNKAAVYFEQKDYDMCIKVCEEAVDIGRENRADYKLIAKAFARIGTAYHKKGELKLALQYYNKSLSESRDQDVVKKAAEVEKAIKEQERLAYIDPELSLQEKQKGNEAFSKGDYPTAIRCYTEAIKRNPDDPKIYSNRAACYTKLAEFSMALKDCDECLRLDPKFIKGYLRKGAIHLGLKESSRAMDAYQKAMDLDPKCQEAIDGYRKCVMQENDPEAVKKRAMQDPEVQAILGDPAMQLILSQMQKDPRALQEHLKNPEIAAKIQKLLECGLIGIR